MPVITLQTTINAPIEVVFDLSRSVELHQLSTVQTHEKVVDGITSGLMEQGDEVTWRAKHLGIYQNLTSTITVCERPSVLEDIQVKGAFRSFRHTHYFTEDNEGGTIMKDIFDYKSPLGILGKLVDWLFLKKYMTNFLIIRNQTIKEIAENGHWKMILT